MEKLVLYFCKVHCTSNYLDQILMIKLNGSPSRSSSIVLDTGWHAISSPHCLHVTEGEVHIACFHSEGAADIIGHLSSDIKLSREITHECDIVYGAPIFNANSIRNLLQIQAKNKLDPYMGELQTPVTQQHFEEK